MTTRILTITLIVATVLSMNSPAAQANPATPVPVIEAAAGRLCGAIDANPTEGGVEDALNSVDVSGFDDMDVSLMLISAMHHVCPQHQELMWKVMGTAAEQELCTERL